MVDQTTKGVQFLQEKSFNILKNYKNFEVETYLETSSGDVDSMDFSNHDSWGWGLNNI